jgi:hypothetical protein
LLSLNPSTKKKKREFQASLAYVTISQKPKNKEQHSLVRHLGWVGPVT